MQTAKQQRGNQSRRAEPEGELMARHQVGIGDREPVQAAGRYRGGPSLAPLADGRSGWSGRLTAARGRARELTGDDVGGPGIRRRGQQIGRVAGEPDACRRGGDIARGERESGAGRRDLPPPDAAGVRVVVQVDPVAGGDRCTRRQPAFEPCGRKTGYSSQEGQLRPVDGQPQPTLIDGGLQVAGNRRTKPSRLRRCAPAAGLARPVQLLLAGPVRGQLGEVEDVVDVYPIHSDAQPDVLVRRRIAQRMCGCGDLSSAGRRRCPSGGGTGDGQHGDRRHRECDHPAP
ncbi:MAG TPA: hypothetical protein VII16_12355 [Actinomycetes bacterium]